MVEAQSGTLGIACDAGLLYHLGSFSETANRAVELRDFKETMQRFLKRQMESLEKLEVPFWGVVGIALAIAPALLFLPSPLTILPLPILISVFWAPLVGWPVTSAWSKALHKRAISLRNPVDFKGALNRDVQESEAGRVAWIPGWIGLFERVLFSLLIGLDVGGGAAFIGVWIGVKMAGGWQSWSKGTTYGRAIMGVGLLGSAMSVLFGVVAGLVIRAYAHLPNP